MLKQPCGKLQIFKDATTSEPPRRLVPLTIGTLTGGSPVQGSVTADGNLVVGSFK